MRKLIPILVITFLVYLTVAYLSTPVANFDAQSYKQIGELTLKEINIYPDPAISRHPYLPLFLYLEAGALFLSRIVRIPQTLILKCFFSLFHLLSVYIIYHLSRKNTKTTLLYALNPVSLLIIAFHGQFDIIPLFLILSSILLLRKKKFTAVMTSLGLAVTLKTWPILFIVPFLKRIPKKYWAWFFAPPFVFFLLYSVFFHASFFSIARVLLVYQGVGGIWGLGKLLSFISTSKIFLFCYKMLFVTGMLVYSFKQKKKLIVEELFELIFLFFIFTPGFGIQWFLWLIPFFFLTKKPMVFSLFVPIIITLGVVYISWIYPHVISKNAISLIFLGTFCIFLIYRLYLFFIMKYRKYM